MARVELYTKAQVARGPNDGVILVANKRKLILPSNKLLSPLLYGQLISSGNKTEGIITGTVAAVESSGKPLGKTIVWNQSSAVKKTFVVPDEHVGRVDCGLFANQGFDNTTPYVNVEIKSKKGQIEITYEIDPKYITHIDDVPLKRGGYYPEKVFWMLTADNNAPGKFTADALWMFLNANRQHPFIGPIGRRNGDVKRRYAPSNYLDMNYGAYRPTSAILVKPENLATFEKYSASVHQDLLRQVILISKNTGSTHTTLGYGIPDRMGMENEALALAKFLVHEDPEFVRLLVGSRDLELSVLGKSAMTPKNSLVLNMANIAAQRGRAYKPLPFEALWIEKDQDILEVMNQLIPDRRAAEQKSEARGVEKTVFQKIGNFFANALDTLGIKAKKEQK